MDVIFLEDAPYFSPKPSLQGEIVTNKENKSWGIPLSLNIF